MTQLGALTIRNEESVHDARQKVRAVAEILSDSLVDATRAATAASEIARLYLQQGSKPRLELGFEPASREIEQ